MTIPQVWAWALTALGTGIVVNVFYDRPLTKAQRVAWVATAAVGLTLLASAWRIYVAQPAPPYNAEVLLTGFSVIGLIWTAYYARDLVEYHSNHSKQERSSRRRALAAELRTELTILSNVLSIIEEKNGKYEDDFPHPILDHVLVNGEAFTNTRTIEYVAQLSQNLGAFSAMTKALKDLHLRVPKGGKLEARANVISENIRLIAQGTRNIVAKLQDEIENESLQEPELRAAPADLGPLTRASGPPVLEDD
jgi:hypothetical protein